ncbi:MAG: LD-carboxypeptidase [Bacilli bacterium]|nr:LD-carboxypeptidase [Bacilli bacterium]
MSRTPPYLHPGDGISLVAPSFGCTTEPYLTRLNAAIKRLEKAGYKIKIGKNVYRADGVCSSASPEERVQEFMEAYLDPETKLVLSVGGGELMDEMLPHFDFEAIKNADPKWFMGFSDNANLTLPLTVLADVKTIYGPNAPSFYEKPFRASAKDALAMLAGEKHFIDYPKWTFGTKKTDPILWRPRFNRERIITPYLYDGPREGTLLGGCLDPIVNLLGTKYVDIKPFLEAHPEGIIWYFEACDLNVLSLRRALFELRESGWFSNAKMFIFGRHLSARFPIMGVDRFNAATDTLGNIPMLFDVSLGHIGPSMPMLNGEKCRVSFENGYLVMDYQE